MIHQINRKKVNKDITHLNLYDNQLTHLPVEIGHKNHQ